MKNDIPYFITGSFAVSGYLQRGIFGDIDFVISQNDFEKATSLLNTEPTQKRNNAGYFYSIDFGDVEVNTFHAIESRLGLRIFKLENEYQNTRMLKVSNHYFRFASPEYVITQKLFLNRGRKDIQPSIDLAKNYKLNHLVLIYRSVMLRMLDRYFDYVL